MKSFKNFYIKLLVLFILVISLFLTTLSILRVNSLQDRIEHLEGKQHEADTKIKAIEYKLQFGVGAGG